MILSRYFHDLHGSYQAEIEDLRYDSEGNDVLQSRLAQKRRELSSIMPMIDCDPVDRKSTRLNSSHRMPSRMPSSA